MFDYAFQDVMALGLSRSTKIVAVDWKSFVTHLWTCIKSEAMKFHNIIDPTCEEDLLQCNHCIVLAHIEASIASTLGLLVPLESN